MELHKLACAMAIFYLNFSILCIEVDATLFNLPFHRRMSPSMRKQVFNVQSDDKGPEYEVVQLRFLTKRSADDQEVIRVRLTAFGKDIHLRLQRNDDFNDRLKTPSVYKAKLTENGSIQLTQVILEDEDSGMPYIDTVHMAAVTLRHGPHGKLQMEGVIGDDLFIKPAPTGINSLTDYFTHNWEYDDKNRNRNSSGKHTNNAFFGYSSSATARSSVHIMYRRSMKSKTSLKNFLALDDLLNEINDSVTDGSRRKRPPPPLHAWVEVLLLVDFDTYTMHVSHGFNDTQIRRYYVSFLNGVDLRFKTLSDPKISLILSEIIICKSRDATPYLKSSLYPNQAVFNGHKAIADFSRHLYAAKLHQGVYPEFDVALLMTNLDMCTEEIFRCNSATVGLAYFMGACFITEKEERWMGVAIVEDSGGFDGILTAAHEIGHLLGVNHDGALHSFLDAEDTSVCSHVEGYIMSNMATSDRIFQWSECSIKQFRYFLNSGKGSCLFNQPNYHNELVESELPGVVLSLDEQCKRVWGTRACAWDSRVCVSLRCYDTNDTVVDSCWKGFPPAAEGSSCGKDLHCRHGKCVSNSLIYSPAWNMAPIHDNWKYRNSQSLITTTEPPPDKGCTEYRTEFCENYFLHVDSREACKNSRIIEECCYSQKLFCKTKPL